MKRAIAIADRAAILCAEADRGASTCCSCCRSCSSLAFASRKAHAEMPVCTGNDMMAELAAKDPALLAKIEQEAAATLNGKGLLWKIETDGQRAFLPVRHHAHDRPARHRADAEGRSRPSTTPAPSSSRPPKFSTRPKMMASLAREPDLMMFTDGTTLLSLLSPEDAEGDGSRARRARHPADQRRQDEAVDAVGTGGAAGLRAGAQGGRRAGARRQARRGRQGGRQEAAKGWKPSPTS